MPTNAAAGQKWEPVKRPLLHLPRKRLPLPYQPLREHHRRFVPLQLPEEV